MIHEINEATYIGEVKNATGRVIVFFYLKNGCIWCDKLKPHVEEFAKLNPGIKIYGYGFENMEAANAGRKNDLVRQVYGINSYPTLMMFENGAPVEIFDRTDRMGGNRTIDDLLFSFRDSVGKRDFDGFSVNTLTDEALKQLLREVCVEFKARKTKAINPMIVDPAEETLCDSCQ